MEPEDLNTSRLAIKSMYHMLRNHFRSSETICKEVKAYLREEMAVSDQNSEKEEVVKEAKNEELPQSLCSDRENRALNRHSASNLGKRSVRQPDNLMCSLTN